MELRASHKHPSFPQEWVVLASAQPFLVLVSLLAVLVPFGTLLYAVTLYCFLGFLYGTVEISLAQFLARLVAHDIQGNHFREIVLVAILLLQTSVYVSLRAVEIGVVSCMESVPPARLRGVFLRGASCDNRNGGSHKEDDYMSCTVLQFISIMWIA